MNVDVYDLGILVGAGLTAYGFWSLDPALLIVAIGVGVIAAAVYLARRARRR